MCLDTKFSDISFDTRLVNKIGSIHFHSIEIQLINHHLTMENRHQLNINYHFSNVSNSIFFSTQ